MKMKLKFLLLLISISLYTNTSKADGDPTIPVIPLPTSGQGPHQAPSMQDVYAFFNRVDITLSLVVSSELEVVLVEIYKNGNLIITDNIPTLYYYLSTYGCGNYSVHLTTEDETTYIGNFTINE